MSRIPTDWPRDEQVVFPGVCWFAFALAAVATGFAGAYLLLVSAALYLPGLALRRFVDDPRWDHLLGGPTLLVNSLAALFLIGCRAGRHWRATSALLLAACAVGLGFWAIEHAHFFGRVAGGHVGPNDPLSILCLRLVALLRVAALGGLAAAVPAGSGSQDLARLARVTVGAAVLAFTLWIVLAATHLDLGHRPPRWTNIRDDQSFALLAGSILARAISFVLAAVFCIQASINASGKSVSADVPRTSAAGCSERRACERVLTFESPSRAPLFSQWAGLVY